VRAQFIVINNAKIALYLFGDGIAQIHLLLGGENVCARRSDERRGRLAARRLACGSVP
jgi:hypothetical protein